MRCFGVFLVLCSCLFAVEGRSPTRDKERLRPDTPASGKEDRFFWREYAKRDLQRRLAVKNNNGKAKNVILFIGDGMGVQTVSLSRIYKGQKRSRSGEMKPGEDANGEGAELVWESFPNLGLSKTYNVNYQVSDSASTANALLSGVKTNFGVAGIDASVKRGDCSDMGKYENAKLENIVHWSQRAGKATGVITTARVTHATPANAFAHSLDRNWEADSQIADKNCHDDIAKQLVYNEAGKNLKVIFGGGRQNFLVRNGSSRSNPGLRNDEDLTERFQNINQEAGNSYRYLQTTGDLRKWVEDGGTEKVLGRKQWTLHDDA